MRSRPQVGRTKRSPAYRAAIARKADHGDAWYALANLKTYRFMSSEIAPRWQAQHSRGPNWPSWTASIWTFAAAARRTRMRGDYERAFRLLHSGNALKRQQTRYNADHMSAELAASRNPTARPICSPGMPARLRCAGSDLHPRPAARRLDPARTDPRLAQPGRRHAGAARYSGAGPPPARAAGRRSPPIPRYWPT